MNNTKTAKRTPKNVKYVQILRKNVISEIRLLPDNVFLEQVDFTHSLNDEEAMKKFQEENKEDIQWIMNHLDIKKVIKKAQDEIAKESKSKKK